jgi:hypothetical protein
MRISLGASLLAAASLMSATLAQPTHFVIEAEDFDFNGGQHQPDADVMPYYGGAYEGLAATHQVDYFRSTDEFWADVYRYGETPNAAMFSVSTPEALDRVQWSSTYNFKLSFLHQPSWFNYSRSFPAGNYRVYAAFYDNTPYIIPDRIRGKVGIVTAGVGSESQTIQGVGEFVGTGSGRWEVPSLVMLKSNNAPAVISLNGSATLRFTSEQGDLDCFFLVPENAPGPTVVANSRSLNVGQSLVLTTTVLGEAPFSYQWRFNGVDIPGATSATYQVSAVGMEQAGLYSVFVSNAHGAMISSPVLVKVSFPISIGDTVSPGVPSEGAGALMSEMEQDVYTFHGTKGDRLFVEGLLGDACSGLSFRLNTPTEQVVVDSSLGFCGSMDPYRGVILPETGTYTVTVYTRGFLSDANYSFRIIPLPVGNTRTIAFGETVEGISTDLSTIDVYQFESGSAGAVYVQELAGMGCAGGHVWAIYDSNGTLLKADPLGPDCQQPWSPTPRAVPLPSAGTYSLVIVHGVHQDSFYSFQLFATAIQTHSISVGSSVTPDQQTGQGVLEGPGAADIYEFTGAAGQSVYLFGRLSAEDANVSFFVEGVTPALNTVGRFGSAEFPQNIGLYELPYTGTYRIVIMSPSDSVGSYSFQLLPTEGTQKFEYSAGQVINAASAPAGYLGGNGAVDEFTMILPEPGALLSFLDLGSEGSNMTITVQEIAQWQTWPFIFGLLDGVADTDMGFCQSGTYRITVAPKDGDPNISGAYSFATLVHHYPVANPDDNFKTKRGKAVRIPKGKLMANDSDADGDMLSWFDFSFDPILSHGTVQDQGDTLLFTPNAGFVGVAEFTYRVQDPYGLRSANAAVKIQVVP